MVAGGVSIASVIGDYGAVVCYYRWGCVADVVIGLLFVMILVRMLMCCDGFISGGGVNCCWLYVSLNNTKDSTL